jgi:hypothetical protein
MRALRYLAGTEQERIRRTMEFIPQKPGAETLNVMFAMKVDSIVFH